MARGRLEELYVIIERAARFNGITLPANYKKSLEAVVPPTASQSNTSVVTPAEGPASINDTNSKDTQLDANASPLVVVFSKAYWRTTCLTLVVWLTLIIIYFGLTLHLSNLGGNIYVNTVSGRVEGHVTYLKTSDKLSHSIPNTFQINLTHLTFCHSH